MAQTIRRAEEILAYRSLHQILVSKPRELWTARFADSVVTARQTMADKKVGLIAKQIDRIEVSPKVSRSHCEVGVVGALAQVLASLVVSVAR